MLSQILLGLVISSTGVLARGCGPNGHDHVAKRNTRGPEKVYVKRQSTEQSEAGLTDPTEECTAYSYAPVTSIESTYPAIWQTASILSSDTTAQSIFSTVNATVNSKLPGNAPSGISANGSTVNVVYNSSDVNCWWTWRECTTPAASTGIPPDVTTVEPGTWGFGFDDGPNCSHNALYDFLVEQEQKATMFFIGSNVMDWPLQALRAVDDGHEICVHTWSHQYMTSFTNDVAFAELYYARQAIKDILGVTPTCWRPPYGDVDNRIRVIAEGLNLTTIVWSDDTDDWKVGTNGVTEADVDANYQSFITSMQNGSYATYGPIVLNHELNNYTMSEMIKWYPQIKSAFTHIVPLASALNVTHPYAEQNYTFPDFAQYIAGQTNTTVGSTTTSSFSASSASGTSSSTTSGSGSSSKSSGSANSASASAKTGGAVGGVKVEWMRIGVGMMCVVGVVGMMI